MILIIGAMAEEVSALTSKMTEVSESLITDIKVVKGLLADKEVVVAQSGVGKVNAAYTTSTLIAELKPSYVINIGSAGGLLEGQKVGDVVVATSLQYHDFDIGPTTHTDPRFIFNSSSRLVDAAVHILEANDTNYHLGLIVTGDQFITKHQVQFKTIQEVFPQAICVEMEAAAIAAVCKRSNTEFIVLRSLSDITHTDGNEMAFEEYLPIASENSARICLEFVKTI